MHFSDKNSAQRLVLDRELDEFLIDREAQNLTANTLRWYRHSLSIFHEFVIEAGVTQTGEITPAILRRAVAKYLRYRPAAAGDDPLWVKMDGTGCRQVLCARSCGTVLPK